jgi:SsrA-binding protein
MKLIANNRKARFNYAVEEEIEAGLMLMGSEVKSIREGKITIGDGYVAQQKNDLVLMNVHIAEYKGANRFNHTPMRPRKLLLHKKQIVKLISKVETKGYSIIPLAVYFNEKNIAKVKIGLCKGKKLYDKRASIKERDEKRRMARGLDE